VLDAADSLLCATCIGEPPAYTRARSVLNYDDGCRGMILGFKHADQTYAATAFGVWLARAGSDLLVPGAMLAPVPLHRWKLFSRRYNQAALLAHAVGRHAGLTVFPGLLIRHRRTTPQGGHSRTGRLRIDRRRAHDRGHSVGMRARPAEGWRVPCRCAHPRTCSERRYLAKLMVLAI